MAIQTDSHPGDARITTNTTPARLMNDASQSVTIIKPKDGWPKVDLLEVWRYRDLLVQMVYRDFSTRYRQSVVGPSWALIHPLFSMVIHTFVFSTIARLPSDGLPYPVFNFCGSLPWIYFSGCLSKSSESTISGNRLITKVYFPRVLLPLSKVAIGLIDLGIQFLILLALLAWYGITPSANILFVPVFVIIALITALSGGLWVSAIVVKYRDLRQLIQYAVQAMMWLTPVAYATSSVPDEWLFVYSLNPIVHVVDGFRWAVVGSPELNTIPLVVSILIIIPFFVSGLYFFRRSESTFADMI